MTENTVTVTLNKDDKTAVTLHGAVRNTTPKAYDKYISEHGVTVETVGEHVKALADLSESIRPFAADGRDSRKNFCNTVRNGLNTHLGKVVPSKSATALLTSLGVKATLEQVTSAWHAAQQ